MIEAQVSRNSWRSFGFALSFFPHYLSSSLPLLSSTLSPLNCIYDGRTCEKEWGTYAGPEISCQYRGNITLRLIGTLWECFPLCIYPYGLRVVRKLSYVVVKKGETGKLCAQDSQPRTCNRMNVRANLRFQPVRLHRSTHYGLYVR